MRSYCKKARQTAELIALLDRLLANAAEPARERLHLNRHTINAELIAKIVSEYAAGGVSTYELARRHRLRRNTVRDILRRNGVSVGPSRTARFTADDKAEIARRRADGATVAQLASRYGVSLITIRRAVASSSAEVD
ncbi:helix-turn-helix domain-containing protein [Gryllotalpicola reticulitermitis]|uniref:Helix-turn-helix domain-containing protein n=1 Tax=Gryllotalpicola reticulitermitis TaxID=1184153 RepID=A0ABV8Q3G2_9MICO